jgi:hypothetical protein
VFPTPKPVVLNAPPGELVKRSVDPEYPVVTNPPDVPICICIGEVPLVDTSLNKTVICFIPDGNPVKSTTVVLALTVVPSVSGFVRDIEIEPAPFVTVIPVPAPNVALVNVLPVVLPISS